MNLTIPKIIMPLALSGYASAIKDVWQVWVNPPLALLIEWDNNIESMVGLPIPKKEDGAEKINDFNQRIEVGLETQIRIMATLLSQDTEEVTADDLRKIVQETQEADPMFWKWLKQSVFEMIREHRDGTKKA